MKGARALIFPSRWYETAGLTILEAQALGVPCLVSKNCAGREFVNKQNLFWGIEELKKKIEKVETNFCIECVNNKEVYLENILRLYEEKNNGMERN